MKTYALWAGVMVMVGTLLTGCQDSGPQKNLRSLAGALNKKDPTLFMAQMDVRRYAVSQIINRTQGDAALRTLDSMGRMLGLGGMEDLLGSVVDTESKLRAEYTRGVSTGELMLQCRKATTPDCPWVPESLEKAVVKELTSTTAVAQVTTPANITSWLALVMKGDHWVVVGQAPLETQAAQYTSDHPSPMPQAPLKPANPAPKAPPAQEKPQEPVKL